MSNDDDNPTRETVPRGTLRIGNVTKYKNREVAVHILERRADSSGNQRDYPLCGARVDLDNVEAREGTVEDVSCVRCQSRARERGLISGD